MKNLLLLSVFCFFFYTGVFSQDCIKCHSKITPNIVTDWEISKHSEGGIDCSVCHGDEHTSVDDIDEVMIPTPETCNMCHSTQVEQYSKGKHALAWISMEAMPTTHMQPMELIQGMKGCGGCHKIGTKSDTDIEKLKENGSQFGVASCDACHTRHTFSLKEARSPQACQTCHMGFDHPQWEMYSSSKHGVRYLLKQKGILDENTAAPTCQTCHMHEGNHEVRTAWGFLAVRLPMPEDEEWAKDRTVVLKGLGVLDPEGNPTKRLEALKSVDVARLTEEAWQKERDKMLKICSDCHSDNFAEAELKKGDDMIRQVDNLMAQAITIVAGLYQDGLLKKPENYTYNYPDLLAFHDAPTSIEQKLFVMFLKHRMRAFQGTFHMNPDYALWYGWAEMRMDLQEIKELAEEIRKK